MTRERYLSDEELERFMASVRSRKHKHQPRDHAFFALLANTGMRPSEVMALTRGDLHLSARPPWLKLKRVAKKNAASPIVQMVLNRRVASVVGSYVSDIHDKAQKVFPFSKRQSERLFHYYRGQAGIEMPFKVYALRHTVGMKMWRHTRDLRLIQAVMGHVRLKASAIYVHVSPERILAAYEKAGIA